MTQNSASFQLPPARPRAALAAGLGLFALIAVLGLSWAKWDPYAHKLAKLLGSRTWTGPSILSSAGKPAPARAWPQPCWPSPA